MSASMDSKKEDSQQQGSIKEELPVDFEAASSLTGFGLYNYLLLLSTFVCTLANQFSITSMSYLLPAAECDLNLRSSDKGLLNAIGYAGMITSAFAWGFMADIFGRRKLLIIAYSIEGVLNCIGSFTQSFIFLVIVKFISGIVICGPLSILKTFISEFHCSIYRTRVFMISGLFIALTTIIIPGIAWLIIPLPWEWTLINEYITYNSWRLFIAVGLLPNFLAAFLVYTCTETPKFLMTKGKLDEALEVFRTMYKWNTGKDSKTYTVKQLKEEQMHQPDVLKDSIRVTKSLCLSPQISSGWNEAKRMFLRPLRTQTMMIFIIQFSTLYGMNTIRLWAPQLFASIEEYTKYQEENNSTENTASLCEILTFTRIKNVTSETGICGAAVINGTIYVNNMIIAAVSGVFYITATFAVNYTGKKPIMLISYIIGAICSLSIYWSINSNTTLILVSLYVSFTSVSYITSLTFVVDLFSTSLRNMAMSLNVMFGQFGTFCGNLTFPYLIAADCLSPFAVMSAILLLSASLAALLPNTDKAALI